MLTTGLLLLLCCFVRNWGAVCLLIRVNIRFRACTWGWTDRVHNSDPTLASSKRTFGMVEFLHETKDDFTLHSHHVLQILEIITTASNPGDSLDAARLLLSLSAGSDSVALQFFSAFPHHQINVLARFPIADPACLPILDLFINMTSHECFAKVLTPDAIDFLLAHVISGDACTATEPVCKILNNLTCNGGIAKRIGDLIPCFLSLLDKNPSDFPGLDYLICAIGNSCTLESSRRALADNFPLLSHFLSSSLNDPRLYSPTVALLKNCMFQAEFRDAFIMDESRSGIRFVLVASYFQALSQKHLQTTSPNCFPSCPTIPTENKH